MPRKPKAAPEASAPALAVDARPELWTCNFARAKLLPPDVAAVSIARWPPRTWGKGLRCMPLAPPADLLRAAKSGAIDFAAYTVGYRAHLATLDPVAVAASFPPRAALLCFCDPNGDCHRFLAAEWLEKAAQGGRILEWGEEPALALQYEVRCDHCKAKNDVQGKADSVLCRKCGQYFPVEYD